MTIISASSAASFLFNWPQKAKKKRSCAAKYVKRTIVKDLHLILRAYTCVTITESESTEDWGTHNVIHFMSSSLSLSRCLCGYMAFTFSFCRTIKKNPSLFENGPQEKKCLKKACHTKSVHNRKSNGSIKHNGTSSLYCTPEKNRQKDFAAKRIYIKPILLCSANIHIARAHIYT